jgi:hypothetical protein
VDISLNLFTIRSSEKYAIVPAMFGAHVSSLEDRQKLIQFTVTLLNFTYITLKALIIYGDLYEFISDKKKLKNLSSNFNLKGSRMNFG